MDMGRRSFAAVLAAVLTTAPAAIAGAQTAGTPTPGAQPPQASRFSLLASGAFAPTTSDFDGTRRFTEFAEEGQIEARYAGHGGAGFEAGLRFELRPHWGIAATLGVLSRSEDVRYTARIPHPLYLNRHREVSATLNDLGFGETDGHLALAYLGHAGAIGFSLSAGPSLFHVSPDLIAPLQYEQTYPYDTLTVTSVPVGSSSKTGFGFNLGGGLERRVSAHLAVGAQLRYSRGSAKVKNGDKDTLTVNAGGLQILAGLRLGL
jgi:opacity protein-like surface antigen